MKSKQPPGEPMTAPEPDLQEHQRLIDRALTQTAVRHIAREAGRGPVPRVMTWELVIGFATLLIIAAIAVLVVGILR
jgi:hypothetical protein